VIKKKKCPTPYHGMNKGPKRGVGFEEGGGAKRAFLKRMQRGLHGIPVGGWGREEHHETGGVIVTYLGKGADRKKKSG